VHLHVVESGAGPDLPHVPLGACIIEALAPNLPKDSEIAVTISYDASARVHVSARHIASGKEARTEIVRPENLLQFPGGSQAEVSMMPPEADEKVAPLPKPAERIAPKPAGPEGRPASANRPVPHPPRPAPRPESAPAAGRPKPTPTPALKPKPIPSAADRRGGDIDSSPVPIPLCNACGEPLDSRGTCTECGASAVKPKSVPPRAPAGQTNGGGRPNPPAPPRSLPPKSPARTPNPPLPDMEDEILELPARSASAKPPGAKPKSGPKKDEGEADFWSAFEE
jgi:hypothetical protein